MKTRKNNWKTQEYFNKLPVLYIVGCWARYGIRAYHCEINKGKMKVTSSGIPYVWDYYDCNGTCDEWRLVPLSNVTTGSILAWSTSENQCHQIAQALNYVQFNSQPIVTNKPTSPLIMKNLVTGEETSISADSIINISMK